MNYGSNDGWADPDAPPPTEDEEVVFAHPLHGTHQDHPMTLVPLDVEDDHSNEEMEEEGADNDGQETTLIGNRAGGAPVNGYYETAGPSFEEGFDYTDTIHPLRNPSRSARHPSSGRSLKLPTGSHARNPACPIGRSRFTSRTPESVAASSAIAGSAPRRSRRSGDSMNSESHSSPASRGLHTQGQPLPRNRRLVSSRPTAQDSSPPPALSTALGPSALEPHINSCTYNLRPRGSSSTSNGSGRGYRRDSFSRTANSDGLFEDTEVELQNRKRRRGEPGSDPAAAGTLAPGYRKHLTTPSCKSAPFLGLINFSH